MRPPEAAKPNDRASLATISTNASAKASPPAVVRSVCADTTVSVKAADAQAGQAFTENTKGLGCGDAELP